MRKYVVLFCVLALIMLGMPMSGTDAMAKLDPALVDFSGLDPIHQDSDMIPVIIRLQGNGVITEMTMDGKFFTNTNELNGSSNLTRVASLSKVLTEQGYAISNISNLIDGIEIINSYQLTTNAIRALVPRSKIMDLAEMDFVKNVWYEAPQELHRWHSRTPMNCWPVYNQETDLDGDVCLDPKGRPIDGTGIVCSVTDTGLDYTHVDFGKQSKPEGAKVVISHDFADTDEDCQEEEGQTHGTCCAGIIAGDGPDEQEKGIAPKAKLAGYKIANSRGYLVGDIGATWEMMVKEGIDVSNNSWGRPGGWSSFHEQENNAVLAGVSVIASQGNNGPPGPSLPVPCGSTSSPENVIGVGATLDYAYFSKSIITDAPDIDDIGKEYKGIWGVTTHDFTDYGRPIQVLDCGWGREGDFAGLDLNGKIALIQRGPKTEDQDKYGPALNFSTKVARAKQNGAIAIMLYNHSAGFIQSFYLNVPSDQLVPSFEMLNSQGLEFVEMLHAGNDWDLGNVDRNQNDVFVKFTEPQGYGNITGFTSSGPTQYGSLKPDVCAPGEKIRTAAATWSIGKTLYGEKMGNPPYTNVFNGTSAAGPFVCGAACLVRQARPEWGPLEVKRSLMNTANLLRRYKDDNYVPFLSQGMGRVDGFNACMTDILIQPPSALIVVESEYVKIDDPPEEWEDRNKKAKLPADIKRSLIAFKVYNYSSENTHNLEMSYEVNSRQADEIKVNFTTDTVTIEDGSGDQPSSSWVGLDIEWPVKLTGGTNDIVIWFTDKKTGQKWHTGITLFNNNPTVQGARYSYASFLEYTNHGLPPTSTPNGDGITDGLDVNYTLTNGSYSSYSGEYDNYADGVSFMVKDYNEKTWQIIHSESILELGEHEFSWDGLDGAGEYLLPDGEWYLGMRIMNKTVDWSIPAYVSVPYELTYFKWPFQVDDSVVPPLPLVSAYPIPSTPGKGSEFELGIYIQYATNIKSIQFDIILPGLSDIAKYMGNRKGDFMFRDASYTANDAGNTAFNYYSVEQMGEDKFRVDIQRPLDGVSGEGWLTYLKLLPIASNYLDVTFDNLNISYINEETMAEEYKFAFYKTSSITIDKEYYDPEDFNHDGNIDEDDLDILTAALGSTRGESRYTWRCDLDYNGIIDMNDMVIFAQAYED